MRRNKNRFYTLTADELVARFGGAVLFCRFAGIVRSSFGKTVGDGGGLVAVNQISNICKNAARVSDIFRSHNNHISIVGSDLFMS